MAISFLVRLLLIILLSPTITKTNVTHAHIQCLEHEQALLVELKNQLVFNSSYSTKLVQWNNETDDCCRWEGVECDDAGHVRSLHLDDEAISDGLNGSSSLFSLKYLEKLSLANNALEESELPREFQKLTHLTSLILTNCSLKGSFPEIIFKLQNLQHLDLSHNPSLRGTIPQFPQTNTNFSGFLPDSISNLIRLSHLDLSNCKFSGFALGNLTQLVHVNLSANLFSGSISSNHFEGLSNLTQMDLSNNSLSGTIPISILALPSLQKLDLHSNHFSGKISEFPVENISSLSSLDLSGNRLESPIPHSFFKLPYIKSLILSDNMFNDTFQLEKILSLPNLEVLDLSNNNLSLDATSNSRPSSSNNSPLKESSLFKLDLSRNKIAGEIPSWIWEIGDGTLSYLNLSCNMLVGLQKPYHIPASLSLDVLDLNSNQLRGELPSLLKRARNVDLSNNYFDKSNDLDFGNFSAPFLSYLSLKNNSLCGSIPIFISKATSLKVLDLSVNNLSGSIPPRLFENIQVLDLGRNNITGQIPDNFSPNCNLKSLDLSNNNLVGDVPVSLANCSLLTVLNLPYNKLTGTVPTSLCKARELQILDLSFNNLNGNIPLCLLEHLRVLNLGRNNITARIPEITADCRVQYLDLSNNNLIGEVPESLAKCNLLEVMDVGGNQIDGSFPCTLPLSLRVLVLRDNRFHGEVRCNKSWPNLQIIDIAKNNFGGYLDPESFQGWRRVTRDTVTKLSYKSLGFPIITPNSLEYYREEVSLTIKGVEQKVVKIWPDFTSIDLSCNNFQGDIPGTIGELDALYLVNLSHNSLTGTIPKSFGKLKALGALDLSANQLTGEIPKEIAGLTFLQVMNVSHNKLVGQIPVGSQVQTFPGDCFEGNAGLCGLPLNISCTNTHVSKQGNMQLDGKMGIEWDYVFGAAGYAVGLGTFSWLLLFCPRFREKYLEIFEDFIEKIFEQCQQRKRRDRRRRVVRNQVRRQEKQQAIS